MMESLKSHMDLEIWKNSINLVMKIYRLTSDLPENEKFGLTNQMRRASVSVPSNIAEGAGRRSPKEFIHFLYISAGSLAELETQYIISIRLNYIKNDASVLQEIHLLMKMIKSLIRKLQTKI